MPVPVQDQIVHRKHGLHILLPSIPDAEIKPGLPDLHIGRIIIIQCKLAFTTLLEILRFTQPGSVCPSIDLNLCMDQGIRDMLISEQREQTVDNDLIYAFIPNHAIYRVKIGKLIVLLPPIHHRFRF